jgi:hypothetical protein
MATDDNAEPDTVLGYYLPATGPARAIAADALVSTPVALSHPAGDATDVRLDPAIAMLLAGPLAPGAGPGAATRAIGAVFVAAHLVGEGTGRFVFADCAVGLPLTGPITVWSGTAAGEICLPEEFGDLVGRLGELANAVGGLAAGQLAGFGRLRPGAGTPAGPGTIQLWGPGSSALIVTILRYTDQLSGAHR